MNTENIQVFKASRLKKTYVYESAQRKLLGNIAFYDKKCIISFIGYSGPLWLVCHGTIFCSGAVIRFCNVLILNLLKRREN